MNRPKIALTLEQLWHRVPGGTGTAGLGMAKALAARSDLDVVGVAARHREPPLDAWTPPIKVHELRLPRALLYETWHRLRWPSVESAVGDVDVIHATSIAMPPRKDSPVVVTIHDLAFLHDRTHFTPRGVRFFERGMELARGEADRVICPSTATLDDCLANGFERDRLRLVPMGTDIVRASAEEITRVKQRHGLLDPYVLWTGTIEPRKNLPRLLDAFRQIEDPDVDLVLVGPQGWNEDLDALLGNKRERVRVLGFVPPAELRALYGGAEVFCFPSLFEGFGLPVLEAMAQGTPVVTSSGTSTAEIGEKVARLVSPTDTSAIAEAMDDVLRDKRLAMRMGEDGLARAAEYSWDRTADRLTDIYRELL